MRHKAASDPLPPASSLLPDRSHKKGEVIRLPVTNARPTTRARLTKAAISKLTCPAGKSDVIYWDDDVKGLGLRVYRSERRVWVVQYRDAQGRTRRTPVGKADIIDPTMARKAARELLAKVAGGANPSVERRQAKRAARVADLIADYLTHVEEELRASSFDLTRRNLRKYAASLHGESVDGVDRGAIARLHRKLGEEAGRAQANRVLASLSAMWVWGLRSGLVSGNANPCAFVQKFGEATRERVLSAEELRLVWVCTGEGRDYHRIVRILILTACRRQEIGSLRWGEIDGHLLVIPAARMKAGRVHEVPLSHLAVAQLPERGGDEYAFGRGRTGFDGWGAAKLQLDARIEKLRGSPLAHWSLHDLRRTFSTMMHERDAAEPHIIEAVLAHAQRGVAGVYNRASYREAKRTALNEWAQIVSNIVGEAL
ncbi:hypothetical protein AMST5_03047 [freshwater sediment metagenome]|uniref:Tyr recombinase domain-containing protein n=1 Tax=freshwater sediment metagenome TaxID=556182 RepID=A0AA48RAB7_9ZZZZ